MVDQIGNMLDKLEEEIRGGKKTILGNLRAVDDTKCLEYINRIRELMPHSLTEARVILQDKENIIENAKARARDIVATANEDAEQRIAENAIVAEAKARANAILDDAQNKADNLTAECYRGVMEMFDSAEKDFSDFLQTIDNSKREFYNMVRGDRR